MPAPLATKERRAPGRMPRYRPRSPSVAATWRTIASVDRPLYSAPSAPCTLFFATSSGHAIAHASVAQTPPLRKPPSSGRAISCGAARSL